MQELLGNLGIDWRILIAQAINFLLILWLLKKFVFTKIISHLEDRRDRIEQGLELTEKAKHEMGRISEARTRELEKARTEAEKVLTEARTGAVEKEKEAMALARLEAEKIISKARQEAKKEKKSTVLRAKSEIQKLSSLIAEKILGRSVREEDQEKSAREVMDYFEKYAK